MDGAPAKASSTPARGHTAAAPAAKVTKYTVPLEESDSDDMPGLVRTDASDDDGDDDNDEDDDEEEEEEEEEEDRGAPTKGRAPVTATSNDSSDDDSMPGLADSEGDADDDDDDSDDSMPGLVHSDGSADEDDGRTKVKNVQKKKKAGATAGARAAAADDDDDRANGKLSKFELKCSGCNKILPRARFSTQERLKKKKRKCEGCIAAYTAAGPPAAGSAKATPAAVAAARGQVKPPSAADTKESGE